MVTGDSRARNSVFSTTHSLLRAIGAYTGCYITLIAAAIPSESGNSDYFSTYIPLRYTIAVTNVPDSVHYVPDGKASRQNWTDWDTDSFRIGVARPFRKYIKFMGKFLVTVTLCTPYTDVAQNPFQNPTRRSIRRLR